MSNNLQNEQFNDILNKLKQKNAERKINIWIPSLSKGVEFKHLTIDQQKVLIKSSIRENLLKLDFSRNLYDILKQNIITQDVRVDELNIVDMISIGLTYRSIDVDNEYGFYYDNNFYPVNLEDICKKIRTIDMSELKSTTITSGNYHMHIRVPTIHDDKLMNDALFEKYKDVPTTDEAANDMLTDIYTYEAVKYIKQIDIVSPGDDPNSPPVIVDFTTLSAAQKLQVISEVPLTILNKLVNLSEKVQDIEKRILNVKLTETQTAKIEINSAFFT